MFADKISDIFSKTGKSLKSIVKLALQSRRSTISKADRADRRLIILGNGPSLADNIARDMDILCSTDTLAVNFAGNTPDFIRIRPKYYLLMDPHFFKDPPTDPNVPRLFANFNNKVDWDMILFLPVGKTSRSIGLINSHIRIENFNPVGIEGFQWLQHMTFNLRIGLPRPRNVMVPAIMTGIWLGYKNIYILGADHSWLRTLDVDDDNIVVSIQPHFYKDGEEEHRRVATMFRDIRLHELLYGFHLAFKGYHAIRRYADSKGINIYNSTPASYIDAFIRRPIRE